MKSSDFWTAATRKRAAAIEAELKGKRLSSIAAYIRQHLPQYTVEIEAVTVNTDRHPEGVRWRIPGKGREGNKLTIRDPAKSPIPNRWGHRENLVHEHNAAETYRRNSELAEWVANEIVGFNAFKQRHDLLW